MEKAKQTYLSRIFECLPIFNTEAISNDIQNKNSSMESLFLFNLIMRILLITFDIAFNANTIAFRIRICQTLITLAMIFDIRRLKSKTKAHWIYIPELMLIYAFDVEIYIRNADCHYYLPIIFNFPIFCIIGVTYIERMKLFNFFIFFVTLYCSLRLYIYDHFTENSKKICIQIVITHISEIYTTYMFLKEKKSRMERSQEALENLECWKHTMNMCPIGFLVMQENDVAYSNKEIEKVLAEYDVGKSLPYCKSLELFSKRCKPTSIGDIILRRINIDTKIIEWRTKAITFRSRAAQMHVFIDVTSSSNYEKSLVQKKYIEMLVATSTHELRAPLNGIKACITLAKDYISPQQNQILERALSACEMQENLINDIMDFAKIQDQKLKIMIEPFNIKGLLEYCFNIFEYQVKAKGLTFTLKVHRSTPDTCVSDQRRIKQIILNLISNAIKFTSKGEITLKTKLKGKFLYFEVIDTGVGIKEEEQEKLFKPFGILDSTSNINKSGCGLGLNLCKILCNYLGGDIKVKSEYNKGAKFMFFVNVEKQDSPKLITNSTYPAQQLSFPKNIIRNSSTIAYRSSAKILVVDDIPLNVSVASHMLNRLGVSTYKAYSGKEAIDIVKSCTDVSAAFIDLNMPIIDGYELCSILKSYMKEGKISAFDLIALTGEEREDVIDACAAKGFSHVMTKPLSLDEIKCILKKCNLDK
jgi:signal transduction histidine kinase/ActR/RegA family two-component response regulator